MAKTLRDLLSKDTYNLWVPTSLCAYREVKNHFKFWEQSSPEKSEISVKAVALRISVPGLQLRYQEFKHCILYLVIWENGSWYGYNRVNHKQLLRYLRLVSLDVKLVGNFFLQQEDLYQQSLSYANSCFHF